MSLVTPHVGPLPYGQGFQDGSDRWPNVNQRYRGLSQSQLLPLPTEVEAISVEITPPYLKVEANPYYLEITGTDCRIFSTNPSTGGGDGPFGTVEVVLNSGFEPNIPEGEYSVTEAGWYFTRADLMVRGDPNSGTMEARLYKNTVPTARTPTVTTSESDGATVLTVQTMQYMEAGDYIAVIARRQIGSFAVIGSSTAGASRLIAYKINTQGILV